MMDLGTLLAGATDGGMEPPPGTDQHGEETGLGMEPGTVPGEVTGVLGTDQHGTEPGEEPGMVLGTEPGKDQHGMEPGAEPGTAGEVISAGEMDGEVTGVPGTDQ